MAVSPSFPFAPTLTIRGFPSSSALARHLAVARLPNGKKLPAASAVLTPPGWMFDPLQPRAPAPTPGPRRHGACSNPRKPRAAATVSRTRPRQRAKIRALASCPWRAQAPWHRPRRRTAPASKRPLAGLRGARGYRVAGCPPTRCARRLRRPTSKATRQERAPARSCLPGWLALLVRTPAPPG